MSERMIEVENISKMYRLGEIGTGSLRRDLAMALRKYTHKNPVPDPMTEGLNTHEDRILWALKDISFNVSEGEVLGIIGPNGSGKSTLLKILSRITKPTKGTVRGRGKVSSILEVGTGFHQDLSGRENIFISGYTLGMKKQEIRDKFDEIVAFSGIERFLDTPVKRYSSGMYVRLAFSVAAHLEPDILIVDEVLAVGDVEFQKKCMGKMQDVSASKGRTILFVSHNLPAISNLCNNAIWLDHGQIKKYDKPAQVVASYIASSKSEISFHEWTVVSEAPGNEFIRLKKVHVKPKSKRKDAFITVKTPIEMEFEFWCLTDNCEINVNVKLLTLNGECVFNLGTAPMKAQQSVISLYTLIPGNLLNNSTYSVSLTIVKNHSAPICEFDSVTSFEVEDDRSGISYFGTWPGIIRPTLNSYLYLKEEL